MSVALKEKPTQGSDCLFHLKKGWDKLATKKNKPGESRINRAQSKDKLVPKYDKFMDLIAFSLREGRKNHLSTTNK